MYIPSQLHNKREKVGDEHRNPPTEASGTIALVRVFGTLRTRWTFFLFFSFLSQSTRNNEKEDKDGRSILQGFVVRHLDPRLPSDYLGETCFKEDWLILSPGSCCNHILLPSLRAQFSSLWKELTRLTRSWCLRKATPILICQSYDICHMTSEPISVPDSDRRPGEEEDSDGKPCSTLNPWRHGT